MKILFLCVANSARSQMAEGFARAVFPPSVEVRSAGSKPSGIIHPTAIKVMAEAGIEISKQYSKSWDQLPQSFLANLDYIVTLCEEECPNVASKARRISWAIADPASVVGSGDEIEDAFRMTREKIRTRVEEFCHESKRY